jgi:Protein of unknown function (DUF2490)
MMMMIKKTAIFFMFILLARNASSQEKDFGIWYGAQAEFEFIKNLELDLSTCLRTFDGASKMDEVYLEAGVMYKFNDYFAAGASYRISRNIEKDDTYYIRHKLFAELKGTLPLGDFKFSLRARFQERYKTYIDDEDDPNPVSHIRGRLKAQYDIPSFPLNPYLSGEFFFPVTSKADVTIDKKRFMVGLEYKFSKKHGVELEYIFQRDYHPRLSDMNIISLNYFIKL